MTTISEFRKALRKLDFTDLTTIEAVEHLIVKAFLNQHNLTPVEGSSVKQLISSSPQIPVSAKLPTIPALDTDSLISLFEELVPTEEAKNFGSVFTPTTLTRYMAEHLLSKIDKKWEKLEIFDPSVGCGALPVILCRIISEKTGISFSAIAANITGVDISYQSIQRAQLLFELVALISGDIEKPTPKLIVGDALTMTHLKTYDAVIANPPYVRYQTLPYAQRTQLETDWVTCGKGNFNLYFAFIELSHKILNVGGAAVFITPNSFIDSLSSEALRSWITDTEFLDDIIDFKHHKVFDVMIYTAITSYSKKDPKNGSVAYQTVAGLQELTTLDPTVLDKTNLYSYADLTRMNKGGWSFTVSSTKALVEAVKKQPLSVDDVFTVRYGIETLRNSLYMFTPVAEDEMYYHLQLGTVTYLVEKSITRKCVKVSTIKSEKMFETDGRRIIYPYKVGGGKASIMDEVELQANYPETYKYLTAIKDELALRDHGKKIYASWFAYGRTQGILPLGEKLLTPLYGLKPRFLYNSDEEMLLTSGCAMVAKPNIGWSIKSLQLLLNSKVMEEFMLATSRAISGGYVSYQKPAIAQFKFPAYTAEAEKSLLDASPANIETIIRSLYHLN